MAEDNILTAEETCTGLDVEFVRNFTEEYDRLAEMLGLFEVSTVAAGTALFQYKVVGSLAETTPDEGEATPLSLFKTKKEPLDPISVKRYAKGTTMEAVLKSGFENAVLKTDAKFVQALRDVVLAQFFDLLANGDGTASGAGLQDTLAHADAALRDAMENNHDSAEGIVFFVNRQDVADALGSREINVANVFGLELIKDFLGVQNVIRTSKVPKGTVYATPAENIHVYGIDFAALNQAGLDYESDSSGLIGVHHEADHNKGAAKTFAALGCQFIPEATNYIVKATVADEVTTGGGSEPEGSGSEGSEG